MSTLAARIAAPAAVAAGAGAVCVAVVWADPTTPGGVIPPCPTYTLFGVLCPGCGTSRMLYSLLHLDFSSALQFSQATITNIVDRLEAAGLVLGAVSMVEMALEMLSKKGIVTLDEEKKAAMVSNLMVVLCGEKGAQPILNTGTLYQ